MIVRESDLIEDCEFLEQSLRMAHNAYSKSNRDIAIKNINTIIGRLQLLMTCHGDFSRLSEISVKPKRKSVTEFYD